jgi:hypothetical protein
MAQKTFCDGCGAEIPMVRLHRVKYILEISSQDEDQSGQVFTLVEMEREFCRGCRTDIKEAIERTIKKVQAR